MNSMSINGRLVGLDSPAYVIAEISANHRQDISLAKQLVHAAKESGADAVKLQTYTPDTITIKSSSGLFKISGNSPWSGKTLYDLYSEAYMPWEWQPELMQLASSIEISLFSSPFDLTAIDFLESINVPAYKIASFELVDIPLITKAASTGKPLIISTGMATLDEIEEAATAARAAGCKQLSFLRCVSGYPASLKDMNLASVRDIGDRFNAVPGLSDHSLDTFLPALAVASGARVIEKHITLRRADGGPDSAFSMEPHEFKEMVTQIRNAEDAIGNVSYQPKPSEMACRPLRRSLYVVTNIPKGSTFTKDNIKSIRPSDGLHTRHYHAVLGRIAKTSIPAGTPLSPDMVSDFNISNK